MLSPGDAAFLEKWRKIITSGVDAMFGLLLQDADDDVVAGVSIEPLTEQQLAAIDAEVEADTDRGMH